MASRRAAAKKAASASGRASPELGASKPFGGGHGDTKTAAEGRPDEGLSSKEERLVHDRMDRSDFNAELFVRPSLSSWAKGRMRLNKPDRWEAETNISGARFQAADLSGEDLSLERETQADVVGMVDGIEKLRKLPGMEGLVVSPHDLKANQPIRGKGTRVKFGLRADSKGKAVDDALAAKQCHAAIRRAISRSKLVVLDPKEKFDPSTGLAGLRTWGSQLRLKRRRMRPWWLLLLPLLFFIPDCSGPETFFGFAVEHRSLLVIVDKSGSMEATFPAVRAEAKRALTSMKEEGFFADDAYVNVIVYDGEAQSVLGGLETLTDETEAELNTFLDQLSAGGGTSLGPALEQATKEVAAHGKPTTLVILTDAAGDGTIQQAVDSMPDLKQKFAGIEVVGHALTPRLLTPDGKAMPGPQGSEEQALAALAEGLDGTFGPRKDDE